MKDEPEAAEGVKTASSATNGGDVKCDMRDLDEQSCRNGVSELAVDINALPIGGTLLTDTANGDDGKPLKNGVVVKNGEKQFSCRICSRTFGYKHVLQNHERTHTGEKPFECPECHKRFTRDHHLKTHMRLHTGEKPYQCSHCDRHFVQVANLRRHLRVHTGERPYACQMCESRFSDSNQLKAHMLIHRGEKPFQCSDCLGRFRRRHHLIHHKCPKGDPNNLGRSRKPKQPKIYEPKQTSDQEDNEEDLDGDLLPELSENEESMADTNNSSSEAEQPSPPSAHTVESLIHNHNNHHHHHNHHNNNNHHHKDVMVITNGLTNGTPTVITNGTPSVITNGTPTGITNGTKSLSNGVANLSNGVSNLTNGITNINGITNGLTNGNRRKPSRTIRILTPQQRELFIRDKLSMQTQAIDMRLSPSSVEVQPVTVIVPNRYLSTVDGVLDLSSSRSDSEIEVMDDEPHHHKSCDCHLHPYVKRPNRIVDHKSTILGLEALNGSRTSHHSDDSNESHLNGGRHLSDDDNSIGAIALTTKKLHVATA